MNANAIYSKSGKGVQEASGKTSNLSRPDRAVLSAIDGRATLADVAQKVGKQFDPAFEKLIETLDKNGYVREVSPGTAAPPKPGAAKPAGKPSEPGSDLDFTAALSVPSKPVPPPQAPPRATPPPAKHTATIPPPPPPLTVAQKAQAEKAAKEQQDAFAKAREEAERKAAADRERAKAEADARMRAEGDAKARADAEKKLAAEAEAKIKAAHDAAARVAAEAKAKAEAETKKAREEAERKAKEAEDTARREREELNRKLEAERKAREEAERKAREEAKRLEEERRKLEEERKREEAERAARRKREEEEEQERKRKKREAEEEEERKRAAERAERKKREEEEEARERAEKEAKRRAKKQQEEEEEARERSEKEAKRKAKEQEAKEPEAIDLPELDMSNVQPKAQPKAKPPEPAPAKATGGFADSLLADLDSFNNRDEEERKEKEEAERKEKEAAAKRAREAEERRQKEEAERREQEEKERRKQEEKDRKAREKAEEREREEKEKQRIKDEEEKRKKEAEDREKKAKQDEQLTAKATSARAYDSEAAQRSRRERMLGPKTAAPAAGAAPRAEKKGGLGTMVGLGAVGLLIVAAVVANFMPLGTADYERAASEALGQPVKIGSARLSVFTGLQIKFSGVAVGDEVKIAEVRASPSIGALTGPKKEFSRIEIDGGRIEQRAIGEALFAKVKAENFSVRRLVARQVEFSGPLALPKGLEVEVNYDAEGAAQSAFVRGPEALVAKLSPKGSAIEVDLSASSFTLPFAPEISLSKFSLKGTATPKGMSVSEWDGALFNGTVSGTANVNWGDNWTVDGVVTARNINAAVFAPALLSDGRGEGSAKFLMRGQPGKLAAGSRLDGNFTVNQGVLGSVDLSRAIQTQGKQTAGRTQFKEMNGQVVYDRGTISLRNVTIGAGQLNAGASAEISQSGALSGRIIADVKVASQTHRATLSLGGNLKEPVVRN